MMITPKEAYMDAARKISEHNRIHGMREPNALLITEILDYTVELYTGLAKGTINLVGSSENLSTVAFCDEFICKNCDVHLQNWVRVVPKEYEDGFVDYINQEYEFKFCPNCGAIIKEVI